MIPQLALFLPIIPAKIFKIVKALLIGTSSIVFLVVFLPKLINWIVRRKIKKATALRDLNPKKATKNGHEFVILRPLPFYKIVLTRVRLKERYEKKSKRKDTNLLSLLQEKIINGINITVLLQKTEQSRSTCILMHKKGFFKNQILSKLSTALEALEGVADLSGYEVLKIEESYDAVTLGKIGVVNFAMGKITVHSMKEPSKDYSNHFKLQKREFLPGANFIRELPAGSTIIYSLTSARFHRKKQGRGNDKSQTPKRQEKKYSVSLGISLFLPLTKKGMLFSPSPVKKTLSRARDFKGFARAIVQPFRNRKGNISFSKRIENLFVPILIPKEIKVKGEVNDVIEKPLHIALNLATFTEIGGKSPNLRPVLRAYTEGGLKIGYQMYGGEKTAPFTLPIEDLKDHVAIVGRTGSGKSMLARKIANEILENSSSAIWIFDFHGEWIDFSKKGFKVISPATSEAPLSVNIFDPQNDAPSNHATFLSTLIKEILKLEESKLSPQMERVLTSAIDETVSDIQKQDPVSLIRNLWNEVKEMRGEISGTMKTFQGILNRLEVFFRGIPKKVFWVSDTNLDIKKLSKENVVFDLSGLSRKGGGKKAHALLVNIILKYLLSHLYTQRKFQTAREPSMFIILEEARWLIPWHERKSSAETTTIEDFAILSRKYGISLIFLNQDWKTLSKTALNNVSSKFIMSGRVPEDFCSLPEKVRDYVQHMPRREAIVDLSDAETAVHIQVEKTALPKIDRKTYQKFLIRESTELREAYTPIRFPFKQIVRKITNEENIQVKKEKKVNNKPMRLCDEGRGCEKLSLIKMRIGELFRTYGFPSEELKGGYSIQEEQILNAVLKKLNNLPWSDQPRPQCISCGLLNSLLENNEITLREEEKHELAYNLSRDVNSFLES